MTLFTDELEGDHTGTPSYASVQAGLALIAEFDEAAPSRTWPSTVQHLHEIQAAADEQHGGPLTTPELEYPRRATWDEIRQRLADEKGQKYYGALPTPPAVPTAQEDPAEAVAADSEPAEGTPTKGTAKPKARSPKK